MIHEADGGQLNWRPRPPTIGRRMGRSPWLRRLLVAAVLAVGTIVVYAPAGRLPFVNYDDNEYVYNNPHVTAGLSGDTARWAFTTGYAANYHPLTWLSLAADASVSGPDLRAMAAQMHRTNVALHAAVVAVLFLTLAFGTGADVPAAIAAAVFAVHPVHVESVAWVVERKDVLYALFYLLAIASHGSSARAASVGRRRAAYVATVALGTLALLCKAMAVTLPVVLLLVDHWPLRRLNRRAAVALVPLVLAAVGVAWATVAVQASGGAVQSSVDRPLPVRLAHVPTEYVRYLGKFFWPTRLSPFYPYRPVTWSAAVGSVVILAAITGVAVAVRRRAPYALVGWLWFVVSLVPVIGLVQVGRQSIGDRYLYLPMVGLLVAIVWSVNDLTAGATTARVLACACAAGVVSAAIVGTRQQIGYWSDTRKLFERALALDADNSLAHAQLGYLDKSAGDLAGARRHYEQAVRLDPRYGDAAYNLANLLVSTDPAAAAGYYRTALAVRPHDAAVENNLGVALSAAGRPAEAAAAYRAAAADGPAYADPHVNLGHLLLTYGRPDLAAREFAAALRIDPSSDRARRGLAAAAQPHR